MTKIFVGLYELKVYFCSLMKTIVWAQGHINSHCSHCMNTLSHSFIWAQAYFQWT